MPTHVPRLRTVFLLAAMAMAFTLSCATPERAERPVFTASTLNETAPAQEATIPPAQGEPETATTTGHDGPLSITVQDALLMALENNRALKIERFNPAITQTAEEEARAEFDPLFTGEYAYDREKRDASASSITRRLENQKNATLGVSGYLPTGTDVEIEASTDQTWSDLYSDDLYATRLGLSVTQALLRGAGLSYNLATLRQARLDTGISRHELRGYSEFLVAQVEETYWDYALIQRQIEIFLESLKLAEQQKSETEEMIRIGSLAESELAAAEAEIALRRESLINARSDLEKTRLNMLRLLNPPGSDSWGRHIALLHRPVVPDVTLDEVDAHVRVALRMRPDLNQARLKLERGDLETVKTKNGLLPKMDFFITLGKTGYAGSFSDSYRNIDDSSYDIRAGVNLEYPFMNRKARALHRRSLLSKEQAEESVLNLSQLVQVDVRSAYIEVNRTKEQIAAKAATRTLQEEKVRIEMEKFRVGKSTTLLVAQAQRDLLASRISEVQTIASYLKSLIELYRLEGSLLERRGIAAPAGMRTE